MVDMPTQTLHSSDSKSLGIEPGATTCWPTRTTQKLVQTRVEAVVP